MILTALITILQELTIWALKILPEGTGTFTVPSQFHTSVAGILSYAEGWNWILPVVESVTIVRWTILITFYLVTWHLAKMVIVAIFRGGGWQSTPDTTSWETSSTDMGTNKVSITRVTRRKL